MHFPGFHGDAAKWLVEERDIVGIGVDTLSLDHGASTTFDTHLTILPAGKYGLENLRNLSVLMGKAATIMVGIPRYQNGSGGPCRVLAMV
jgi:kynurenine formamidase